MTKTTKAHLYLRSCPKFATHFIQPLLHISTFLRVFFQNVFPVFFASTIHGFFSESVCISYLEQKTLLGGLLPVLEVAESSITVLRMEEAKTFWLLRNGLAAPEKQINLSVETGVVT